MKNPIKYSFKTEIWPLLICLAAIGLSIWSYPHLPAKVITHWDINGKANGWSSREFNAVFFPALTIVIYAIMSIVPKFDPKSERYNEFAGAYLIIRDSVLLVMLIAYAVSTFGNLGYKINIGTILTSVVSILIIIIGNYMGKVKPNWFMGIRTPWTLSSDNVWNKTHRLGSRLFVIVGVCTLIVTWIMPAVAVKILLGGMIFTSLWVYIYSYILFKNEKKEYKIQG